MPRTKYPKISVAMPVLNESFRLPGCLKSIRNQNYPQNKVEIIIADGGSTDDSVKIATQFGAKIFPNSLRTSEAGKAIAIKHAKGDLVILLDGDNLLTEKDWLRKMIQPLMADERLIGSEALHYTHRYSDGFIDRYCSLIGMNDPLCYWLGAYDRYSLLSGSWTGLPIRSKKREGYLEIKLVSGNIPTIGSNGCIFRRDIFEKNSELQGDYLFDMDIIELLCQKHGPQLFAKVKVGVVHLYCGSSIRRFARKQFRRVKDFLFRRSLKNIFVENSYEKRKYQYGQKNQFSLLWGISKFSLSCLLVVPLLYQSIYGYTKKRDLAWFAHPILCWMTLVLYAYGTVESIFLSSEYNRDKWGK